MDVLEGYTSSRNLAKDLTFAMAIAPSVVTVACTMIKGYGWHVSAEVSDIRMARAQVEHMLGKVKFNKVSWQ